MKTTLISLATFSAGTLFGGYISLRACSWAIKNVSLEAIAERSVKDVAAAYENTLSKNGVVEKLTEKFDMCVQSNSRLQKRVWSLENPAHLCRKGCELK